MASASSASSEPPLRLTLAGRVRFARRVALLALLLAACLPLHGAWRLVRARSPWPSRFLGASAWACGVRVRRTGKPPRRDVFVVANHCSWLDILILGGATGCAFVAKAELEDAPLVGWLAGLNDTIYVKREDRRAIPDQIAAIRAVLHDRPVAIFPEATTSDGTVLLPFKPALLQVLEPPAPGMRVQPLFIDYGAAAAEIAWGQEDGARNALRLLSRRGALPVTLHCLERFDPVGGRKAVAAEARRRIEEAITASGAALRV
jgi:1-acyl-sn-glycerol-3-phosphate acyltransferase